MNLFPVDVCPAHAARALDDKRVGKIALEAAQLLCSVMRRRGVEVPYKSVHHPLVDWADSSTPALNWLWAYYKELLLEFEHRFGKQHGASVVYKALVKKLPPFYNEEPVEFFNNAKRRSLGLDYTHRPDVLMAYRDYLNARWSLGKPTWTLRGPPVWARYSLRPQLTKD